jgi:putative transposase
VIQRGHRKAPVLESLQDKHFYLENLIELKAELGCKVFGYCLMSNHTHLIIDPGEDPSSLAQLMKRLGGRFTRYVNKRLDTTGTAWDGRYKSSPIDSDEYLLACSRYVELNPNRAGLTTRIEDYHWSSYRVRAGYEPWTWLDPDGHYLRLGSTPSERARRYRRYMNAVIPLGEWSVIRTAAHREHLTGGESFVDQVERQTGQRVTGSIASAERGQI